MSFLDDVQCSFRKPDKLCFFSGIVHSARPPFWLSSMGLTTEMGGDTIVLSVLGRDGFYRAAIPKRFCRFPGFG